MAIRTRQQVLAELRHKGQSIASWARANQLQPAVVYQVLSGRHKGLYGNAHWASVLLGLKEVWRLEVHVFGQWNLLTIFDASDDLDALRLMDFAASDSRGCTAMRVTTSSNPQSVLFRWDPDNGWFRCPRVEPPRPVRFDDRIPFPSPPRPDLTP